MKKSIKKNMVDYTYLELQSVNDVINSVNGEDVNLTAYQMQNGDDITIENDGEDTYPDLMFHYVIESAVVNGVPVQPILISGSHPVPPSRPK